MKSKITLVLSLLFTIISMGQNNDNLKNEILHYEDENIVLIEKGRKLLIQKFKEKDFEKVLEIKDYLLEQTPPSYAAFTTFELIYLMYWTQEYKSLGDSILKYNSVLYSDQFGCKKEMTIHNDFLSETLDEYSYKYQEDLVNSLQNAEISPIKKDFLILYFKAGFEEDYTENAKINAQADQFLTQYPNSKYEDFVRQNIRYKYSHSDWSFGYEIFAGYGIHKKGIADNFRNSIPLGFNIDAEFHKFIMNGRLTLGPSKTLKKIKQNDIIWNKGSTATIVQPELSMGYLYENKSFKIYPFAGFTWITIDPSEDDTLDFPELKDLKISALGYNLGLNLDIKFNKKKNIFGSEYSFIRFRYNYNLTQFEANLSKYSGTIHNITIGFGKNTRVTKREL